MARSTDRRSEGAARSDFAQAAGKRSSTFFGELWHFARHNKKWWLIPILLTLVIVAVLVVLAATGAGPLVYTLF